MIEINCIKTKHQIVVRPVLRIRQEEKCHPCIIVKP